jgi:hypothetical protein
MKIKVVGDPFGGICGGFGRRIGRGGVAEGLRAVRVRPTLPAPARIGVVVAGFCARVVTVAVVDGG